MEIFMYLLENLIFPLFVSFITIYVEKRINDKSENK